MTRAFILISLTVACMFYSMIAGLIMWARHDPETLLASILFAWFLIDMRRKQVAL